MLRILFFTLLFFSSNGGCILWSGNKQQAAATDILASSKPKQNLSEFKTGEIQVSKLGIKTVYVPPGTFMMGSPESESGRIRNEIQHKVQISRGFHIMQSEVTQGLYQKVMGKNPSKFQNCGKNCPVEQVTWYDMARFANALSSKEGRPECYEISGNDVRWSRGFSCTGWRLPTEAEWEYAARGAQNHVYSGSDDVDAVGWHSEDSGSKIHPVCGKKKNAFGLCDMSGNVWEWVWDWIGDYPEASIADPMGSSSSSYRVFRGGSWYNSAFHLRAAYRSGGHPSYTIDSLGARLVRTAAQ